MSPVEFNIVKKSLENIENSNKLTVVNNKVKMATGSLRDGDINDIITLHSEWNYEITDQA